MDSNSCSQCPLFFRLPVLPDIDNVSRLTSFISLLSALLNCDFVAHHAGLQHLASADRYGPEHDLGRYLAYAMGGFHVATIMLWEQDF